jgi:glycosyltransferase involved in cell wall biosynthesis
MKILFVLEYYEPHIGGVETLFKSVAQQLVQQGHQVTVVTNRYDAILSDYESIDGVEIYRYRFYNRYLFTFFAWLPVLKYAKEVDIIHTTSYNAALPAWIAGKIKRKDVIITFHEYWGKLWFELPWLNPVSRYLNSAFERMLVKLPFKKFVVVSDFTRSALAYAGVGADRLTRIYNGIQYSDFEELRSGEVNKGDFNFLFFGRVGYSKGLDVLLKAASLMDTDHPYQLKLILPQEPLLKKVHALIDEIGLSKSAITIEHSVPFDQLLQEIASADAVIIPSYSEGFCYAAVETMAIGTPLIISGKGALSEVVTGQHINYDSIEPRDLADAMVKAIEGEWTYTDQVEYPLQHTIDQYIDLYEDLTNSAK